MSKLTHLDQQGNVNMVDVTDKAVTQREAVAGGQIVMSPATLDAVLSGNTKKGDVITTARLAGIMAAKQTSNLIPLCHPLPLGHINVDITPDETLPGLIITATVRTKSETGVEMEALTAVSIAALTVYDMAKALDKRMNIEHVRLIQKSGGRSGDYHEDAD